MAILLYLHMLCSFAFANTYFDAEIINSSPNCTSSSHTITFGLDYYWGWTNCGNITVKLIEMDSSYATSELLGVSSINNNNLYTGGGYTSGQINTNLAYEFSET